LKTNKPIYIKSIKYQGNAVDSTIIQHNNIWWLFCTKNSNDANTNLYLYYSDYFDGQYIAHPANPVKSDVRSSRPAGTPFVINNSLYRPTQDSSITYGGKIAINKIIKLNTLEFEEETLCYIFPFNNNGYNCGIHTVCGLNEFTIFDAKKHTFVFDAFKFHLTRKIKKLFRINNNDK